MFRLILLYFYTLRFLKPVQLLGRIWFRLYTPRCDLSPAPGNRTIQGWTLPAGRRKSLYGAEHFWFLGEEGTLTEVGWDGPERDKLWRYNQHYFDDLNAVGCGSRVEWHRELLRRWVAENPPGEGSGWEPYPMSLRIVNWVKFSFAGESLPDSAHQSLAVQARFLNKRLEWHLLGNHLFANAKALVFAGCYFSGSEAAEWLRKGLSIIRREIGEQVLSDGGHFERSTMYHVLALEDVLDLLNLAQTGVLDEVSQMAHEWKRVAESMIEWLGAMNHPDGEISFFNDAAFGIAPDNGELFSYAQRLGLEEIYRVRKRESGATTQVLKDSGYISIELGNGNKALLDVAPVGPDYLPGHAHADTLSFELSLFGQRVLVNSGTSEYGTGDERLRQRGTAAHNTLVVDGKDSSEVWSGFRVARRARAFLERVEEHESAIDVKGSHDGYKRLPGKNLHEREWWIGAREIRIRDRVLGKFNSAVLWFHFHPDVRVSVDNGRVVAEWGEEYFAIMDFDGARNIESRPSSWHPEFGQSVPSRCVTAELDGSEIESRIRWMNS